MVKQMCGNYRSINQKTKSDHYPIPSPKELFDGFRKARVFNTLDLRSRYHQLPLRFEDRMKTAFWEVDEDGRNIFFHWKFFNDKTHKQNFSVSWIKS